MDETHLYNKLDEVHKEVITNRNTSERAIGALSGRVAVIEQWKMSTEETLKTDKDNWTYLRSKLDSIDEKVDGNRVALAKWAGVATALVFGFELFSKWVR